MDNNNINNSNLNPMSNGGYPYHLPEYGTQAYAGSQVQQGQQQAYAGSQAQQGQQQTYAGNQSQQGQQQAYAGNQVQQGQQQAYAGNQSQQGQQQAYAGNWAQTAGMADNSAKHVKKTKERKSGFGVTLAKAAAIALVFGLVAGSVFTGVSYLGGRAVGTISENVKDSDDAGTVSDSDSGNEGNDAANVSNDAGDSVSNTGTLSNTAIGTGAVADLTDVSAIAEEVMPSIVAITNIGTITYQGFFGQSQTYESQSCGSGIIIAQDDNYIYIVTNNHVVSGADSLTVQFVDDSSVSCEVQGTDSSDDLAVVKVEINSIEKETLDKIKVATIGDSDALKVGEATIAIGNALGYGQSVTTGIVSALGRTVTVSDGYSSSSAVTNTNLIQTDAAINPGNSGGALLNAKGEVIGINSAKYSDTSVEGIGYAIPITDAMDVVSQLIENGTVTSSQTAYLGIQGTDVSADMSQAYGMPVGVYVYSIISGTGAEKAGLRQGDIITGLDDKKITTMSELKKELENYEAGDQVILTVERLQNNGYEEMQITVSLTSVSNITQ